MAAAALAPNAAARAAALADAERACARAQRTYDELERDWEEALCDESMPLSTAEEEEIAELVEAARLQAARARARAEVRSLKTVEIFNQDRLYLMRKNSIKAGVARCPDRSFSNCTSI